MMKLIHHIGLAGPADWPSAGLYRGLDFKRWELFDKNAPRLPPLGNKLCRTDADLSDG